MTDHGTVITHLWDDHDYCITFQLSNTDAVDKDKYAINKQKY